jgi:histidyl-tRNA synthetase
VSRGLQAPRGTFDVQPGDARRRLRLQRIAEELLARAGYEPFSTPIFEDTELFSRGVGESTDVVQKEMFTFEDKAGRSLTLRPEATAAICRAYVEHGMHKLPQPVKVWTAGPFFRHEAPQAGRYRQFTQLDIEALGSDDPSIDAEQILLLDEFLRRAGAGETRLLLASLGTPETRAAYLDELREYLRARESELSDEVRERLDLNPLRAFDADHPGTQAVVRDAPRLLDRLGPEDLEHFAEVRALLDEAGLEYEVDTTLVRGLDYYTRTVFEFVSPELGGAQSTLAGGGRYDLLVEQLGGPHTPAIGWAAGIERILLVTGDEEEVPDARVYVVVATPEAKRQAFGLTRALRERGIRAELEQAGRSLKGQLRQADRIGARAAVIVGEGIDVKDLSTGDQSEVEGSEEMLERVEQLLR